MKGYSTFLVSLATLVFLHSGAFAADEWYVSYEKGVDAVHRQDWQEAVNILTEAIRAKPDSKAHSKTYGLRFIDYFPYVYRGLALYKLGNATRALADFEREEKAGEIGNASNDDEAERILREHLDLLRKSKAVETKVAEGIKLYRQKEFQRAIDIFQAIDKTSPDYSEAQKYIALAQGELQRSTSSPPKTPVVKGPEPGTTVQKKDPVAEAFKAGVQFFDQNDLDQAEVKFKSVLQSSPNHDGAKQYLARIRSLRQKPVATGAGSTPAIETKPPAGGTAPAGSRQDALFRDAVALFAAGKGKEAKTRFTDLRQLDPSYPHVAAYLDSIGQNEVKTKQGISSFFEGEYQRSINELADAAKKGGDNVTIYAFLACAYASQYYLMGAEDKGLQQNAIDAFKRAKQLDPAYKLDARFFSPRLIALFNIQ